jgi:tetratricopeptide (TPR) repeat protein
VGSRFKDAALWLDGRPLLSLSPFMAGEEFDRQLRDYGVGYLLCSLSPHGIPDFEAQMVISDRWTFAVVFSRADIAVFNVQQKAHLSGPSRLVPPADSSGVGRQFRQGMTALKWGAAREAAAIFQNLRQVRGLEIPALFYSAVAEECASNLDEASRLFQQFRLIPQAAGAMVQVRPHEEIIAMLREAEVAQLPEDRATLYHSASLSYWVLGLRTQAILLLRRSLAASPDLFVGHAFGALYALEEGDTSGARKFVARALRERPADPLSHSLQTVIALIDSLPRAGHRASVELAIGNEFFEMGLFDLSIDQARKALQSGEDAGALRLLSEAYMKKDRRGPALDALRRLGRLDPGNEGVQAEIRRLSR